MMQTVSHRASLSMAVCPKPTKSNLLPVAQSSSAVIVRPEQKFSLLATSSKETMKETSLQSIDIFLRKSTILTSAKTLREVSQALALHCESHASHGRGACGEGGRDRRAPRARAPPVGSSRVEGCKSFNGYPKPATFKERKYQVWLFTSLCIAFRPWLFSMVYAFHQRYLALFSFKYSYFPPYLVVIQILQVSGVARPLRGQGI